MKKLTDLDALFDNRAEVKATDQGVSRIRQLIAEEDDANREVDQLTTLLEDTKARRTELRNQLIPTAMLDAGMREFTTEDGLKAKIAYAVDGALGSPKTPEEVEEKERKLDCLIEHGGGEIVKQVVTLQFPKEMVEEAETMRKWLIEQMEKRGWNVAVSRERSVHHQTLGSWIRERMEAPRAEDRLPDSFFERMGLWFGEIAKITRPKKPAA